MSKILRHALATGLLLVATAALVYVGSADAQSYVSRLIRPKITNGPLIFPNGEQLDNDTDGTIASSGAFSVTGALTASGDLVMSENGESIVNDTDGTFDLTRDEAGTVTITASDDDATAALTIDPGGAAALTLGSADVTGIVADAVLGFRVPRDVAAAVTARTCDATNAGYIVYVDDNDDGAAAQLCACMEDTNDATFDWVNLDGGADCTLL